MDGYIGQFARRAVTLQCPFAYVQHLAQVEITLKETPIRQSKLTPWSFFV